MPKVNMVKPKMEDEYAEEAKSKGGRKPIEFDLEKVQMLGQIGCTHREMAHVFDCSTRTIERRMADEDSEFCRAYKSGFADLVTTLRRKQVDLAFSGDKTMLIWLGKQLLGQTDKSQVDTDIDLSQPPVLKIIELPPEEDDDGS